MSDELKLRAANQQALVDLLSQLPGVSHFSVQATLARTWRARLATIGNESIGASKNPIERSELQRVGKLSLGGSCSVID